MCAACAFAAEVPAADPGVVPASQASDVTPAHPPVRGHFVRLLDRRTFAVVACSRYSPKYGLWEVHLAPVTKAPLPEAPAPDQLVVWVARAARGITAFDFTQAFGFHFSDPIKHT